MKIREGYVVKEIAGAFYAVPTVKNPKIGNGMIKLNETAYFIWKKLEESVEAGEIAEQLSDEFDVDEESAKRDVSAFVAKLVDYDIVK